MVVGSVEIHPAPDAFGVLCPYAEAYSDVAESAWAPYRELYPELFVDSSWRLPCISYVVRSDDVTVLVDTGVGPPGLWDWQPEREGLLAGSLEALGIGLDDVDVVFLTHLHIDHIGWNTDLDGIALFPRARYVVHADALARALTRAHFAHIRRCVEPIADRFDTITGDAQLAPQVQAVELPGHYPGHMGLRIGSGGGEVLLLADAVAHPALLDRPDWRFAFDEDVEVAARTRETLVAGLDDGALVVCGHFPGSGIGRAVRRDGRTLWEEVS